MYSLFFFNLEDCDVIFILLLLGYYLSDFGQSCTNLCEGLGEEFACMKLVNMKNKVSHFFGAIDFSNFRLSANVSCTTDESSDDYAEVTDPSLRTDTGVCRGYKEINRTNCDATGGQNIRRLCKCLDKGIGLCFEIIPVVIVVLRALMK